MFEPKSVAPGSDHMTRNSPKGNIDPSQKETVGQFTTENTMVEAFEVQQNLQNRSSRAIKWQEYNKVNPYIEGTLSDF